LLETHAHHKYDCCGKVYAVTKKVSFASIPGVRRRVADNDSVLVVCPGYDKMNHEETNYKQKDSAYMYIPLAVRYCESVAVVVRDEDVQTGDASDRTDNEHRVDTGDI
tara:strand:+ start:859 stop:1182 length:324 start_codon:yes stop_codon:yes gene_type:complete